MRRKALRTLASVLLILSGIGLLLLGLGGIFRSCVLTLHTLPGRDRAFEWIGPALLAGLVLLSIGVGLAYRRRLRRRPQPVKHAQAHGRRT